MSNDKEPANPFSEDLLSKIFKVSSIDPNCLAADEDFCIEFKENFSLASNEEYAKILASFANADGGYIVFGVSDSQKRMIGLKNNNFRDKDPAKITNKLREFLAPDIKWQKRLHPFNGMEFGLLYGNRASIKPVIITKNGREVKEGDIYYRYPGESLKIRYPEIRQIIEDERLKRLVLLEKQVKTIMEIGVENVGILDASTGKVTGPTGSFLIDESILPKLSFIKEGEFREKEGAPTLRLIGDVVPIDPIQHSVKTIIKPKIIRTPEIVHAFLDRENILEPTVYIKSICFEPSVFLPIYYLMKLGGLTRSETLKIIDEVQTRRRKKDTLANRLKSDDNSLMISLGDGVTPEILEKRKMYRKLILAESLDRDMPVDDIKFALQAIRTLAPDEINENYLRSLLKDWFDRYYSSAKPVIVDNIRRAICYIDKLINE